MNGIILRKWLNFHGFSVTIPHKHNALDYTKEHNGYIDPLANKIGAVNTLIISMDSKVKAYNTDYTGAMGAISNKLDFTKNDFADFPVAVVGAGGVSRAIVAGLSDAGAKVTIYNRTLEKAHKLAEEFNCDFAPIDELPNMDAMLLVNCTSIGMHPNVEATPVAKEYLKRSMAVFDTVYNPAETQLLQDAKSKRAKRIDGVSMFVNQAMVQFMLFTGSEANEKLMRKTVVEQLSH